MQTLQELGSSLAMRRRDRGLKQKEVAARAGVTQESLSRLEKGHLTEFGTRKLMALLAVLEMELHLGERGLATTLDDLRKERGAS